MSSADDPAEVAAGLGAVLAASAFTTMRDRIPGAELLRTAEALVGSPGSVTQALTTLVGYAAEMARLESRRSWG